MEIKISEFEGVDADPVISLFEYGILWQKNEHCEKGELYFIMSAGWLGEGSEEHFSTGYFDETDLPEGEDLISLLNYCGLTHEEWEDLPLGQKVADAYNHDRSRFVNLYGSTPKSELIIIDK